MLSPCSCAQSRAFWLCVIWHTFLMTLSYAVKSSAFAGVLWGLRDNIDCMLFHMGDSERIGVRYTKVRVTYHSFDSIIFDF